MFQLVKLGLLCYKSSKYDSLRLKINSFVTCIHIFRVLESTSLLWKVDIGWCVIGQCRRKWKIVGSVWRKESYTAGSLKKLWKNLKYGAHFLGPIKLTKMWPPSKWRGQECKLCYIWLMEFVVEWDSKENKTRPNLRRDPWFSVFRKVFLLFQGYFRSFLSSFTVCPFISYLYKNWLFETTLLVL